MTTPRMRAGDTDRQHAVDQLGNHLTDGRLTSGEFDERVGKAYAAVYLDELPALFDDLPGGFGRSAGSAQDPFRTPAGGWASQLKDGWNAAGPAAGRRAMPPWAGGRPRGFERGQRPPVAARVFGVVAALSLLALVLMTVGFVLSVIWPVLLVIGIVMLVSRGGCGRRRMSAGGHRSGWHGGPGSY